MIPCFAVLCLPMEMMCSRGHTHVWNSECREVRNVTVGSYVHNLHAGCLEEKCKLPFLYMGDSATACKPACHRLCVFSARKDSLTHKQHKSSFNSSWQSDCVGTGTYSIAFSSGKDEQREGRARNHDVQVSPSPTAMKPNVPQPRLQSLQSPFSAAASQPAWPVIRTCFIKC